MSPTKAQSDPQPDSTSERRLATLFVGEWTAGDVINLVKMGQKLNGTSSQLDVEIWGRKSVRLLEVAIADKGNNWEQQLKGQQWYDRVMQTMDNVVDARLCIPWLSWGANFLPKTTEAEKWTKKANKDDGEFDLEMLFGQSGGHTKDDRQNTDRPSELQENKTKRARKVSFAEVNEVVPDVKRLKALPNSEPSPRLVAVIKGESKAEFFSRHKPYATQRLEKCENCHRGAKQEINDCWVRTELGTKCLKCLYDRKVCGSKEDPDKETHWKLEAEPSKSSLSMGVIANPRIKGHKLTRDSGRAEAQATSPTTTSIQDRRAVHIAPQTSSGKKITHMPSPPKSTVARGSIVEVCIPPMIRLESKCLETLRNDISRSVHRINDFVEHRLYALPVDGGEYVKHRQLSCRLIGQIADLRKSLESVTNTVADFEQMSARIPAHIRSKDAPSASRTVKDAKKGVGMDTEEIVPDSIAGDHDNSMDVEGKS